MTRTALPAGSRIGPFVLEALIGRGGMGDVYRAVHQDLDRTVALKVLAPGLAAQESFAARFIREARTMRNLDHPAIITVYDAGEADGQLYFAMRLVGSGRSLKNVLADGTVSAAQGLALLRQVAEALDYAHARGVIHRDIKPANILIDDDGRPILADFGLAKAMDDSSLTLSRDYLGTPVYMAPEQAAGKSVSHRTDLYSLACVAFELLTGTAPYTEQDSLTLLLAHGSYPVPRVTERKAALPSALDDVFAKALAKSPVDRYPSALAFVDALAEALDGPAGGARASDRGSPAVRRPVKLAAAGLAVVAATGAIIAWGDRDGADAPTTTSPAPTVASASASARPPRSATPPIAVGSRFYRAVFDSSGTGFQDAVGRPTDPTAQSVDFDDDGALKLAALTGNANAGTDLRATIGAPYVVMMTYSVSPGSLIRFDLGLRWAVPGKLAYLLRTDTSARTVALVLFKDGRITPLAEPIIVPSLDSGRDVSVTVSVSGPDLALWLDGRQVTKVRNTDVPETAGTIPGLDVFGNPGSGAVRVSELTYYNAASTPSRSAG